MEAVSLNLDNLSGFNLSKVELKDKISAEKERILKENKRNRQHPHKKMAIELLKRPLISNQQKALISIPFQQTSTVQTIADKESLLSFLKQSFPPSSVTKDPHLWKAEPDAAAESLTYYGLRVSCSRPGLRCEQVRLPSYFFHLLSNREFRQNCSSFLYEPTPIELIRTELS